MVTHIISGSLFNDITEKLITVLIKKKNRGPSVRKHCHEILETMVVLENVGRRLSGGEYNKAAKSSETMAFDCPLVCPEILEQLVAARSCFVCCQWSDSTGKNDQKCGVRNIIFIRLLS